MKCRGCGWVVTTLYAFKGCDTRSHGMCGNCFLDYIVREEMIVEANDLSYNTVFCHNCSRPTDDPVINCVKCYRLKTGEHLEQYVGDYHV